MSGLGGRSWPRSMDFQERKVNHFIETVLAGVLGFATPLRP